MVGVPVIRPAESTVRPAGRPVAVQVHGGWPPLPARPSPDIRGAKSHTDPILGSLDKLYAYAAKRDAEHWPAWRAFNRHATRASNAVGSWHETYLSRYSETSRRMSCCGAGRFQKRRRPVRLWELVRWVICRSRLLGWWVCRTRPGGSGLLRRMIGERVRERICLVAGCPPLIGALPLIGSVADSVADVGGLRGVDHSDDLQLCA